VRKVLLLLFLPLAAGAQKKLGVENYYSLQPGDQSGLMPIVSAEGKGGWTGTFRYNYEDIKTASVHLGKRFTGGEKLKFDLTPMAGLLMGTYSGGSVGMKAELEWRDFFLSADPQFCFSTRADQPSFFFNWSELRYYRSRIFGGLVIQHTRVAGSPPETETGLVGGLSFGSIEMPVYLYRPFENSRYLMIGISWNLER
jgi:hypothetical protein